MCSLQIWADSSYSVVPGYAETKANHGKPVTAIAAAGPQSSPLAAQQRQQQGGEGGVEGGGDPRRNPVEEDGQALMHGDRRTYHT